VWEFADGAFELVFSWSRGVGHFDPVGVWVAYDLLGLLAFVAKHVECDGVLVGWTRLLVLFAASLLGAKTPTLALLRCLLGILAGPRQVSLNVVNCCAPVKTLCGCLLNLNTWIIIEFLVREVFLHHETLLLIRARASLRIRIYLFGSRVVAKGLKQPRHCKFEPSIFGSLFVEAGRHVLRAWTGSLDWG